MRSSFQISFKTVVESNFNLFAGEFTHAAPNGKIKTKPSWSDLDFVAMARHVGLKDFIVPAYYWAMERAHPSVTLVVAQSKDLGDGNRLLLHEDVERGRKISSDALMIAHRLLIEVFILQHQHFQLSYMEEPIGQCLHDFGEIWERYKQGAVPSAGEV